MASVEESAATGIEAMLGELLWFAAGFAVIRACLAMGLAPQMRLHLPTFLGGPVSRKKEAHVRAPRSSVKSIMASATGGQHEVVLETWNREKNAAPLPLEALQVVTAALANLSPDSLVDELVDYVSQHSATLARTSTLNAVVDTLVLQREHAELAERFADAAKKRLRIFADIRTYESLSGAFALVGNENKVEEFSGALQAAHLKMTPRGYAMVIKGFAANGNMEAAVRHVLKMKDQGLEVPARAVHEIYRSACSASPQVLQSVLDQLSTRVPLSAECVTMVLNDCAQRDDIAMACHVEKLAHGALSYGSYEALLKLYAKNDGPRGEELLASMQASGFYATEGMCGSLLARCADSQNLRLAEAIAAYLRNKSMMTLAIYKTLMKVYACSGLYDKACDLYQQVRADGIEPDHVMYGCLVKFAVKCGRPDLSEELFDRANGGDIQNYMWLIRAAGAKGDVNKAFELLRQLESAQTQRLDIAVYNSVLDACISNSAMDRALILLDEMKAAGLMSLVTYNTLIKGYCAMGDLSRARRCLREMEEDGCQPDCASHNCILGAAVSAMNFNEAWEVLKEMDRRGTARDHYTVSIMMKAARKAKNPKDAQWALSALDRDDVNVCEDDVLLNTVLDACVYRRDLQRLKWVLKSFETSGMRPSVHTYGLLIKAFSLVGQPLRCRELWAEMVEQRAITPNNITLSCMLDAVISSGDVDAAVALFEEWKQRVPPNTVIYSTLIKGFASQGDPARAMQMYKQLRSEGLQMNLVAYTTLIDAQARVGNMDEAVEMLRLMEEDGCQPNTITYSTLVKGYCMNGNLKEAFRVFQTMLDRELAADTVIFNTLLDGCVRHSQFELADQLLSDMGKYHVEPSNFTLSIIIKMWGKRRRLDDAFEAVQTSLKDKRTRLDAHVGTCLISACMHNRNADRALQALAEIKKWPRCDGADAGTYNALISGLARFGRCHDAVKVAEEAHLLASMPARSIQPVGAEAMALLFKTLHQYNLAEELGRPLAEKIGDPAAWKRHASMNQEQFHKDAQPHTGAPWQRARANVQSHRAQRR